jgi:predicted RNA-binding Zn ribbon-like protein
MSWKGLTGEPLALDLVNTVTGTAQGDVDLLDSTDALRRWLAIEAERLTPQHPDADLDVEAVRRLRAGITEAVALTRAGRPPSPAALTALADAQRAAPGYSTLAWDGTALTAATRREGSPTAVLLADLAAAAVELLADPAVTKIRDCEGPHCRMVFLPTNPRRRWCSPAICGNRVRVARYYETHKG